MANKLCHVYSFFRDFISIFLIKIELSLYFDLNLCYNVKGFIDSWKVGST